MEKISQKEKKKQLEGKQKMNKSRKTEGKLLSKIWENFPDIITGF